MLTASHRRILKAPACAPSPLLYLFVSFVLPKGENDSSSPIIGGGFLDPYNVDYVGQPLNHPVPALLSSRPPTAVMEQIPGARLFLRRLRQSSTSRLVTRSVCRVRIRCCLFSITLEFGVCCITVAFPVRGVMEYGLL